MSGTELRSGPDPDTDDLLALLAHLTRLVRGSSVFPCVVERYGHSRVDDYVGPATDVAPGTKWVGQTVTLEIKFRAVRRVGGGKSDER